jgi:hypothetical protein
MIRENSLAAAGALGNQDPQDGYEANQDYSRTFFAVGVVSGGRPHGEALIMFVLRRAVAAGYTSSADSVSREVFGTSVVTKGI